MVLAVSYNQPKLCPSAAWDRDAVTFAGWVSSAEYPRDIFVDSNNSVYVTVAANKQILVWLNNNVNLPIMLTSEHRNSPLSIFVTIHGDIYIADDSPNCQVDRWTLNTNDSKPVIYVNSSCYDLFVDINNTLYCSMRDHHQVVKQRLNNSDATVVIAAGTGRNGSASNTLSLPHGIFVDADFGLYVADSNNDCIQLFRVDELNATTIAGHGSATVTIELLEPTGIVLDADKHMFIVDRGHHRIVGFGPNGFRCLVGCSNPLSSAPNELNSPQSLSFDSF